MEQYIEIFSVIHKAVFWPLFVFGLFFSGNANVRWCVFFLVLTNLSSIAASALVPALHLPGWVYHVILIAIALFCYRQLLLYRPWYAYRISKITQKIPLLRDWLPETRPRIYSAELAMRSIFLGMVVMHVFALAHWGAIAIGWTAHDGLFVRIGLWQNVLYDAALLMYCVLAVTYALLLLCLIVTRCRDRLVFIKA